MLNFASSAVNINSNAAASLVRRCPTELLRVFCELRLLTCDVGLYSSHHNSSQLEQLIGQQLTCNNTVIILHITTQWSNICLLPACPAQLHTSHCRGSPTFSRPTSGQPPEQLLQHRFFSYMRSGNHAANVIYLVPYQVTGCI